MSPKLIAFTGLDGTGKSTQIDLLKREFLDKNKRVKIIWSRGGYTPGFNLLKSIIRKLFRKKLPEPGRNNRRAEIIKKPLIAKLWLNLAIFDLLILYTVYFRFLILFNNIVIADRYIFDTKIDFTLNFPDIRFEKWLLWKMVIKLSPTPVTIYLRIPLEVALERLASKEEPFPDSKEVLAERLKNYQNYYNRENSIIIEANNPIDVIHKNIIKMLNEN